MRLAKTAPERTRPADQIMSADSKLADNSRSLLIHSHLLQYYLLDITSPSTVNRLPDDENVPHSYWHKMNYIIL